MLGELRDRFNLYADDEFDLYEDFRDHVSDHSIQEDKLIPAGKTSFLGNRCELEVLSHQVIDKDSQSDGLKQEISEYEEILAVNVAQCVHSKYLLHTQAERNIEIDILWFDTLENQSGVKYHQLNPCAMYFKDSGEGPFDEGPNFIPNHNSNWDEILYDLGLGPDPFEDEESLSYE
jgi:hypothetical protein